MSKVCTKCDVEKSLCSFYPKKGGKFGRDSRCIECVLVPVQTYDDGIKQCAKCGEGRALDLFKPSKRCKDGYERTCELCMDEARLARPGAVKAASGEIIYLPRTEGDKFCVKCDTDRPVAEFTPHKKMKDGLCSWCKECHKGASDEHYEENREAVIERTTAYKRQNREKAREWVRTYRERHPERRTAQERQSNSLRRARMQRVESDVTSEWLEDLIASNSTCQTCDREVVTEGSQVAPDYLNVDHIIPINAGGLHRKVNLRVLCRDCNLRRPRNGSDIHIENEWAIQTALEAIA